MKAGRFKIITDRVTRDPRLERRLIEYNRDRVAYIMLLIGGIFMLTAMLW
jgi:hypothetical protein